MTTIPNLDSWNLVPVFGTWRAHDGTLLPGTYQVSVPVRLTSPTEDVIIPAGIFDSGYLNTAEGAPSLHVHAPSTDDPDILERGWLVTVTVAFEDMGLEGEVYTLEVPMAAAESGINLRAVAYPTIIPIEDPYILIGQPGGLALLNAHGQVVNAAGEPVLGGGDIAAHTVATTDVHGIADTAALVLTDDPRLTDARQPVAHTHDAAAVTTGVISPARLGAGDASSETWLRGDSRWERNPHDDMIDLTLIYENGLI